MGHWSRLIPPPPSLVRPETVYIQNLPWIILIATQSLDKKTIARNLNKYHQRLSKTPKHTLN